MKLFTCLVTFLLLSTNLIQAQDVTELCAEQRGEASYYNDKYHGKLTASEEPYDKFKLTTAHRTLAFGSLIQVTNLTNNRTVEVRVNDRGPSKASGRIVDLSRPAAEKIGLIKAGVAEVKIKVLRVGDNGSRCPGATATSEKIVVKPKKVVIKEKAYKVSEEATTYNLWGERIDAAGYGILIGKTTELSEAVKMGAKPYEEGFNQTFILADQVAKDQYVFRVVVGQSSKENANKLGQRLAQKGFKNLFLIKHK
ncbi:MAG: septal ring lytic transglycosylase RlpA family protein [Bacteroidota bacterium]